MSNKALYRVGLIAAILSAVSWFAFVYGQLNLPALSEIDDPLRWFQTYQEARTFFLLYGWGGSLGTLLMVPYVLAFYKVVKVKAPLVSMPVIYAFIGVTLTILGFFKPLTAIYTYVPMGLAADPETLPFLKTASALAVEVLELPWNVGSFLVFGLGIGMIAYYAWRTATGPALLNWVGIIGGIAGITWLAAYLPIFGGPLRVILIIVNILGIIIWSIGLSIVLVRQDSSLQE
jgi:hypothetical protein